MHGLTKKQREVLDAVVDYIDEHNESPTIREISEVTGQPISLVHRRLEALEVKHYIQRNYKKQRSIQLTQRSL